MMTLKSNNIVLSNLKLKVAITITSVIEDVNILIRQNLNNFKNCIKTGTVKA